MAKAEIELDLDDLRELASKQAIADLCNPWGILSKDIMDMRKADVSRFAFELLDCLPTREDIFCAILAYLATDDQLRDLLTEQLCEDSELKAAL